MESNLPNKARPTRKTRTIKEVFGTAEDDDRLVAMTFLSHVLISFPKKKTKKFLNLNVLTIGKKVIIPLSIPRKKIQKTSVNFNDLHANDCS